MTTLITHFLDCCASRRSFLTSLAAAGMGAAGGAVTGWAAEVAVSEVPSAGQPEEGSMYLFAHITLKPGTAQKFTEVLGEIAPLFEKHGGWKLQACYLQADGAENRIIDVWKIPNAEAVRTNLDAAPADPAFHRLRPRLQECVEHEVLQVMTKQPVTIA